MRSPRLYAVFLVGLGVVAAWLIIHRLQEPRYKGKSVRFWFSEFSQANSGRSSRRAQRAAEALQQLGPTAVQYLVDEAIRPGRDTPFRVTFYELLAQFPDSWRLPRYVRRDESRADAVRALQQLKPASTLLLPDAQPHQPSLFGGGICLGEHGHQRVVGASIAPASL